MTDMRFNLTKVAFALSISTALTSVASAHDVLPAGGAFVGGSGVIMQQGHDLTVTQSTKTGVVNWNSFSIGQKNSVDIVNHGGATLNRVTGGDMSVIAGSLKSDGTVFLINQNGIVVTGSGSVVTSGSFVASTRDTTDGVTFAGGSKGKIINKGKISAGGNVVLFAANVKNDGSITAKDTVVLIAGDKITYQQDAGITVSGSKSHEFTVTNTGSVRGRDAQLEASGGNIYALSAHSRPSSDSAIVVSDGIYLGGDNVTVDSELRAGGDITVSAHENVSLGGRSDLVGENIHISGNSELPASLKIADGAVLHAKNKIETSAHTVSIGKADIKAKTWTVDPDDLTIDASAASTIESSLNGGTDIVEQTANSANAEAGNIIVNADISWSSSAKLTLSAYNNIFINSKINVTGAGTLDLETGNGVGGTAASGTYVETGVGGSVSFANEASSPHLIVNGSAYSLIYTPAELAAATANKNYALAGDIDLASFGNWTPLEQTYSTNFNGLGHVIENLSETITGYSTHGGLFDKNNAKISNLGVVNANINSSAVGGGIIAYQQGADARNVWSSGVINVTNTAGGLFGIQNNWTAGTHDLYDSYSNATVTGTGSVGGLVGQGWNVNNSYFTGQVIGTGTYTGGILGANSGASAMPATISNSFSSGKISGKSAVGGIIGGGTSYINISNSYSLSTVNSTSGYAGGIAGTLSESGSGYGLLNTYSSGDLSGQQVGGLIGNAQNVTISNSYSSGNLTGVTTAGGLIANAATSNTISDSYSAANVTADSQTGAAGGLIAVSGFDPVTLNNVYSYGTQTAYSTSGTIAKPSSSSVSETNVFYLGTGSDGIGGVGLSYQDFADGKATLDSAFAQAAGTNRPVLSAFNAANVNIQDSSLKYGQTFSNLKTGVNSITDQSGNSVSLDLDGNSYISTGSVQVGNLLPEVGTISSQNGYQVVYSGTLNITPADLVIAANNSSSVYGQTATLNGYTVSGLVNGDTVSGVDVSTTASSASNVGNYVVTASGAVGTGLNNYNISYTDGTLNITPANLVITANDASSVYGTTTTLNGYTTTGLINGDAVTGADISTAANSTSNVGNYAITASGAVGTGLSNYNISYTNGTLSVTPADLIIAANNSSSVYGTTPTLNGYTASGLVNGDTVNSTDVVTTANSSSNVGSYAITASGAVGTGLSNYNISYTNGVLNVTPASLVVTANDASAVYGQTPTLNSYTTSGLVNGDTVSGADVSTTASSSSNVGSYAITASNAVGSGLSNYSISYNNGTLNITPANLVITANDASSVYGQTPALNGYSVSGLVNGDTVSGADVVTTANSASSVGSYAVTASGAVGSGLSNYNISYENGVLNITPASLVIAANNSSSVYGQTPVLNGYTTTGLVNGDTVSGADVVTTATSASGVGNYAVTASNAVGSGLSNYNISYTNGTLSVTPAALTVSANDASSVYGATPALNGYNVSGLVNGDTVTNADVATTANSSSSVGSYAITASNAVGSGLSNYNISYTDGTLSVTPAALVIKTLDQTATEGAVVLDENAYLASGLVNSDAVSAVTLSSNTTSGAGSYAITASNAVGSGLSNYSISYDNSGILTVNAAPVAPVNPVVPVVPATPVTPKSPEAKWIQGAVLENAYEQTAREINSKIRFTNCQINFDKKRRVTCDHET